jgi:cell division protein FtsQ
MARLQRLPWRVPTGILLATVGLALGWLWFRDSSFAAVERVTVNGTGSSEHERVRAALEGTARGMSTLHVDEEALRDAVGPYSSVADLRVSTDFPHDLTVEVIEHEAVAAVQSGATSVPATGGGLLLDGVRPERLPVVRMAGPASGGRVSDPRTLQALKVAAAAPDELRARTERLYFGEGGMRLDLSNGPDLIFGDARAAATKWRAAARVLGEQSAGGATYLDLRVPTLVAAGGVGPVDPEPTPDPAGVVPSEPSTVG